MHTVQDAHIFVISLNSSQRRALANELQLDEDVDDKKLSARVCQAFLLIRTIAHISSWRNHLK